MTDLLTVAVYFGVFTGIALAVTAVACRISGRINR